MFEAEIDFLNRKLLTLKVDWEVREAINQVISKSMPRAQAEEVFEKLREALAAKTDNQFPMMVKIADSSFSNGSRVAIVISKLREFFAGEIDGWSGGGGRKQRPIQSPLSTGMRR